MTMADKNAFVLQDDCSYCGAQEKEEQQELLYECSNCGTLYCDSCGEDKGCPNCGLRSATRIQSSRWGPAAGIRIRADFTRKAP